MLNFVLCDDNPNVLNVIDKMLNSIFIKNNIDAEVTLKTTDVHELLEHLSNSTVNVLILDIELNCEYTGIQLAEKIRKNNKSIYIIFSTGHLEYALVAYKVKTFDYLPKPITIERLEDTVLRLITDGQNSPKKYIKLGNKNTIINPDSIYYIQKDGMKLIFHTDSKDYEIYSSFNKIADCLPENFVRCHKSFIVNVNKITNIQSNNTILFNKDMSCAIGPKYKNNFLEVFKNGNSSFNLEYINNRK